MRFSSYSMASLRLDFRSAANLADNHKQRIVELIHHPLLQRNDGIVGDVYILRANLSATLRDVAESDAQLFLQQMRPGAPVKRMHLKRSRTNKKTRPAELLLLIVVSYDITDILAKKAFNALAKLLYAIHV